MTLEEAKDKCNTLEKLNLDLWNTSSFSAKAELRSKFRECWNAIAKNGFRILRYKELDISLGYKVPKFKIREDRSEDLVSIVDNRGEGNHHGDCTTRCISFCTGIDYTTIQKEQFKNLAEARAKGMHGLSWRTPEIWSKSLTSRGFCEVHLPRKVAAKVFLRMFKKSSIDNGIVAAKSAHHLAAIDMKQKKILDTWNSTGCRIKSLYVPIAQKELWTKELKTIF